MRSLMLSTTPILIGATARHCISQGSRATAAERSSNLTASLALFGQEVSTLSDQSTESQPDETLADVLDRLLVNLCGIDGPVRITGWYSTIEGHDEEGVPFLLHLAMPRQPHWRSEGMIRASLAEVQGEATADRITRMMYEDDGEDYV